MRGWRMAFALGLLAAGALGSTASATSSVDAKCVSSEGAFKPADGRNWYEVGLKNICARRLLCSVDASVTDAKGVHTGKDTVAMPAGSKDKPSSGVYRLEVGAAGGMAQIDYLCR
jgi:hypothetical protein